MLQSTLLKKCPNPIYNEDLEDSVKEMARRRALPIRVMTGLGSDVDRYVSQSPTLRKQIIELKNKDWNIVWGEASKGTYANRDHRDENTDIIKPIIIISSQFRSKSPKGIAQVVSAVAHEVGHAYYFKGIDLSSVDKCIASYMTGGGGEVDAVINQIIVRKEILQQACIDIFAEAREEDWLKVDVVNFYNDGIKSNDIEIARKNIAEIYFKQNTSNSHQTYREYYSGICKKAIEAVPKG